MVNDSSTSRRGVELGALPLRPVLSVPSGTTLAEASEGMFERGTTCVIVTGQELKIVTEHDLAEAWRTHASPFDAVDQFATDQTVWATTTSTLPQAATKMLRHSIHHLVVVDEGTMEVVGTVSMVDLFEAFLKSYEPVALYATFASVLAR